MWGKKILQYPIKQLFFQSQNITLKLRSTKAVLSVKYRCIIICVQYTDV
jgi:hypothetical protein